MITLICDICGTSYPDTEAKCPTCGYSRAFEEESLQRSRDPREREKVRGGFFSHKNVKKRLEERSGGRQPVMAYTPMTLPLMDLDLPEPEMEELTVQPVFQEVEQHSDDEIQVPDFHGAAARSVEDAFEMPIEPRRRRLNVLNVVLLTASLVFLLSCGYVAVRYGIPYLRSLPQFSQSVETEAPQGLVINETSLTFSQPTHVFRLKVEKVRAEDVVWISDDPAVATVSEAGLVTAVGPGTTTIRASYDGLEGTVSVTCQFE